MLANRLLAGVLPSYHLEVVHERGTIKYLVRNTHKHFELFAKSAQSWIFFDLNQKTLSEIGSFSEGIELIKEVSEMN